MLRNLVLAEQGHDLAGIDAGHPEQPGHLVGEGHLGGVEGVAGVLQGLGRARPDDPDRLLEEAEKAGHGVGDTRVGGPDDHQWRREEVGHPGALAQELGAHRRPRRHRCARQATDSAGTTVSSTVPGGTVLRMTTLWCPDAGGVTSRRALTMSATDLRM